jgi:DNA sulfur modification protein DndD
MDLQAKKGRKNITLVGGLNGRGKTTLHDAILLALYDKQALKYIQENARSYDRLLLEHINKYATDDETYIAVTMMLDNQTRLRIKRSWRRNGKKAEQQVSVEKNGVLDKYLGENWNYYIEEFLPFGIARFFFFNNEKIMQLADDTSFEQIKASIKSAIGVTTIEKAIAHTDEVIRRKKNTVQKFENGELNQAYHENEAEITETDRALAEKEAFNKELEKRVEALTAKTEVKEKEFWDSGGDIGRNRDAIKAEMEKIKTEVESIQAEIVMLASDASTPLFVCRELVKQAYNSEEKSQEEKARRYSETIISEIYRRIINKIDAIALNNAIRQSVKQIIDEELCGHISSSETLEIRSLTAADMALFEKLIAGLLPGVTQRIKSLIKLAELQEGEFLILDAHLENTEEKTMAMRLYEVLKEIEKEKTLADNELDKGKYYMESLERQHKVLLSKRTALIRSIAEKEDSNNNDIRIMKYAAMSIDVLQEFKVRLQAAKLSQLSKTVTKCFKQLVQKDTLIREVSIDPVSLKITLLDRENRELLKSQLSAGEQQMFAISIVWALALTSGYKAPVFIDTPLARLDSVHRSNFISKYLPQASSQVIVLSTDEEVYGKYLDLIRENIIDRYTLLYDEEEQHTTIVPGYFEEVQ